VPSDGPPEPAKPVSNLPALAGGAADPAKDGTGSGGASGYKEENRMDLNTVILGVTAPAMAILAELGNPIDKRVISTQAYAGIAQQLTPRPVVEATSDLPVYDEQVVDVIMGEISNPLAKFNY
jgi:hypothetical protein